MKCFLCNSSQEQRDAWEQEQMIKHGWFIHHVPYDPAAPNHFNSHTHGVLESFGHPDMQICMPMDSDLCIHFFHHLVEDIKKGIRFKVKTLYPDILGNGYQLQFLHALECGRNVLRLIFPDKMGTYTGKVFVAQFFLTNTHI